MSVDNRHDSAPRTISRKCEVGREDKLGDGDDGDLAVEGILLTKWKRNRGEEKTYERAMRPMETLYDESKGGVVDGDDAGLARAK